MFRTFLSAAAAACLLAGAAQAQPAPAPPSAHALALSHRLLVTVEEGSIGGFGSQVLDYLVNADLIRPLHEWTGFFERYWSHQLSRVKERAEKKAAETEKGRAQGAKSEEEG